MLCLAVPMIEESQKSNNCFLRFSITVVEFSKVYKFNNTSCWNLWRAVFLMLTLVGSFIHF